MHFGLATFLCRSRSFGKWLVLEIVWLKVVKVRHAPVPCRACRARAKAQSRAPFVGENGVWCDIFLPNDFLVSHFHPIMIIYQAALLLTCCASISAQLRAETTKVGSRGLMSFDLIAGYQPTSLVTDPVSLRWLN
jgi:hypothetical protein